MTNNVLLHPFATGPSIQSEVDREDAINRCAAGLNLLSELFGSNADDFEYLNESSVRDALYFQMKSIASVLDAVSRYNPKAQS